MEFEETVIVDEKDYMLIKTPNLTDWDDLNLKLLSLSLSCKKILLIYNSDLTKIKVKPDICIYNKLNS